MNEYIIKDILKKKRKHHSNDGWIEAYYYYDENRQRKKVKVATSKMYYRKDTFYKCNHINDEYFNYYKVLKPNLAIDDKPIFILRKRKPYKIRKKKTFIKNKFPNNEEPFVLHFD